MIQLTPQQPKIIVVGSSCVDMVLTTDKIPLSNETVMASSSESFFGGKGANQAVGVSRLGASVYFVGCVGMDPLGQQILRNLVDEGVNVGFVAETQEAETGTAYATCANEKNAIVVVPAANFCLKPKNIDDIEKYFHTADLILLQLEIPMEVVEHTVNLAKKHNVPVGIYAAPAKRLSKNCIDYATFIVAKSNELEMVFGDISREDIFKEFPNKLFVRDDSNSTTFYNGSEMKYYRNDHDHIAHKLGMGDAFTSGFSVALCHKNSIDDCVKFGIEVSLRVTQKKGSQEGLPYLEDLI